MMDTLGTMASDPHFQVFAAVRNRVRAAGTDNLSHFKNAYVFEGGYSLQQNPDEFAALVIWLKNRFTREPRYSARYLEIGTASAGTMRFLYDELGFCFDALVMVDDHGHHRWTEQEGHIAAILEHDEWEPPHFAKHIGDSHVDAAKRFIAHESRERPFDIAFVDGDHRYEGVRQDIELVLPHMRRTPHGNGPGKGIVILHDIIACAGDVGRAWREAIDRGQLRPLAEFVGHEVPLGIAVGEVI